MSKDNIPEWAEKPIRSLTFAMEARPFFSTHPRGEESPQRYWWGVMQNDLENLVNLLYTMDVTAALADLVEPPKARLSFMSTVASPAAATSRKWEAMLLFLELRAALESCGYDHEVAQRHSSVRSRPF